jgi:hypothetical protein
MTTVVTPLVRVPVFVTKRINGSCRRCAIRSLKNFFARVIDDRGVLPVSGLRSVDWLQYLVTPLQVLDGNRVTERQAGNSRVVPATAMTGFCISEARIY